MWAITRRHGPPSGLIPVLLEAAPDLESFDQKGLTALHRAVMEVREGCPGNTLETVLLLIQAGADLDAEADDGRTPLQVALHSGKTYVANILRQAAAAPKPRVWAVSKTRLSWHHLSTPALRPPNHADRGRTTRPVHGTGTSEPRSARAISLRPSTGPHRPTRPRRF